MVELVKEYKIKCEYCVYYCDCADTGKSNKCEYFYNAEYAKDREVKYYDNVIGRNKKLYDYICEGFNEKY